MVRQHSVLASQASHRQPLARGRMEVRQFLKGIAGDRDRMVERYISSPFDKLEVMRNDLSMADMDMVSMGSGVGRPQEFIFRNKEKLQSLAEHRMLRVAVSKLNIMLTATRSFFW